RRRARALPGGGAGRVLGPPGAVAAGLRPDARRRGRAQRAGAAVGRRPGRHARAAAAGCAVALLPGPLPARARPPAEAHTGRGRVAAAPRNRPSSRTTGKWRGTVKRQREAPVRQRQLDEAIAEYLEAVDAGERPDPDKWLARFPDLAEPLARFFAD